MIRKLKDDFPFAMLGMQVLSSSMHEDMGFVFDGWVQP